MGIRDLIGQGDIEDCEMSEKTNEFLCKRGKSAVLMRATKDGLKVVHTKGDPKVVDELTRRMSERARIKSKDDF